MKRRKFYTFGRSRYVNYESFGKTVQISMLFRPPACEFVEPVAQDLEPWSESRRAGGVDWKPWGVTEFNYQKIEEFRQNWKVVL